MTAYVSLLHETVDIGILIGRKSMWGTGVGQDAWDTLINWFITDRRIRKVTAGTLSENKGMLRIMERSGMRREAILPGQELLAGKPLDVYRYAKYSSLRD
jgi:RimJ/RimL family protein N-acetyltransferase